MLRNSGSCNKSLSSASSIPARASKSLSRLAAALKNKFYAKQKTIEYFIRTFLPNKRPYKSERVFDAFFDIDGTFYKIS